MTLFKEKIALPLANAAVTYDPNFLSPAMADAYFKSLRTTVDWQQDQITVFGKTYPQPRLTALFGNNGNTYSYANITMHPKPFTGPLLVLKKQLQETYGINFSSCLLNLYRDGQDSNGWHADDEKELGPNPIIASISLGQDRYFHFRNKAQKDIKHKLLLTHGSLLLMQGETQHYWQHQIPKTAKKIGERINLTFRIIH